MWKVRTFKKLGYMFILMVPIGLYICFRVWQGFPYFLSNMKEIYFIVRFGKTVSYDVREERAMQKNYHYIKQIRDLMPENSSVCFWRGDITINPSFAAYFLYPRNVKIVANSSNLTVGELRKEGCEFLLMSNGLPNFDIVKTKVFLFGPDVISEPISLEVPRYIHDDARYFGKVGLLQL